MRLRGSDVICFLSTFLSVLVILHGCFFVRPRQGSAIVASLLFFLIIYSLSRMVKVLSSPVPGESCDSDHPTHLELVKKVFVLLLSALMLGIVTCYLFPEIEVALNRLVLASSLAIPSRFGG